MLEKFIHLYGGVVDPEKPSVEDHIGDEDTQFFQFAKLLSTSPTMIRFQCISCSASVGQPSTAVHVIQSTVS